jgi:hypothetical protein
MKIRTVVSLLAFAAVAACGSDTTAPASSQFVGTWSLVSVNGVRVPADISVDGNATRVTGRHMTISAGAVGAWHDTTDSQLACPLGIPSQVKVCPASGDAVLSWFANGDTLTVHASLVNDGYVVRWKTFVRQADGSLLKTDDSQTEVYLRVNP